MTCRGRSQGTNAHALLRPARGATISTAAAPALWRPRRFWCTAIPHPVLLRAAVEAAEPAVVLHADLRSAAAAFLSDNRVGSPLYCNQQRELSGKSTAVAVMRCLPKSHTICCQVWHARPCVESCVEALSSAPVTLASTSIRTALVHM
jgi:hypothetical protein